MMKWCILGWTNQFELQYNGNVSYFLSIKTLSQEIAWCFELSIVVHPQTTISIKYIRESINSVPEL